MAANVINGTDLCLFLSDGTGTTKKCIALATTCKLTVNMSTRAIASKDSGIWAESAVGRMNWTVDSDQLFTQDWTTGAEASGYTYDILMDLMIARTAITITLGKVTTDGMGYQQTLGSDKTLIGSAFINKIDLNAPDNANSSYTITLEGNGALTHA